MQKHWAVLGRMCVRTCARAAREREEHVLQKLWVIRGIKLEFQGEKKEIQALMSRDWPLSPLTLIYCFCSFIVWSFNYYTSFYVVYLICSMLQSQNAITAYRMHFILNSVLLLNNFTDMSFDQRKPFPVKDCSPTLLFNHSHQLFHSFTIYFPLVGLSYEV